MTVCKKFLNNVEVDLEGRMQPCSSFQGQIDHVPYDIESYFNSPVIQRCMSDQRQGLQNPECEICWQQESNEIRSLRETSDHMYPNSDRTTLDLFCLDYSLDHICNLKCLMCNETASSAIMAEKKKLGYPVIPIRIGRDSRRLDFLQDNIMKLSELKIYNSGEPLLSPIFLPMVELIKRSNPELNVMISTSGMHINEQVLDGLASIPNLTVKISVDGFDRVNDFIRYPSDWSTIEKTASRLKQLPKAKIMIHSTIQALNIFKIDRLAGWATDLGLPVEYAPINRMPMLDLRVVPMSARPQIESTILDILRSKAISDGNNQRLLLATLKRLRQEPVCEQSRAELASFLREITAARGINARDYIPTELDLLEINTRC